MILHSLVRRNIKHYWTQVLGCKTDSIMHFTQVSGAQPSNDRGAPESRALGPSTVTSW